MVVKPIPEGYRAVTPYLVVQGAATLIEFLKQGFEAKEICRILCPEGGIMHAEVRIGDSVIMVSEAKGECKPMQSSIYLYVENADATYERALQVGGISMMEPKDEFWGDRHAGLKDPSGNHWSIATHQEDVSSEELEKRIKELFGSKEQV
ncbi:VOC family protein [Candidatus Gracilibacteria bacterium]|nr:VOC family protein [Candidatus Gracilibacteria bacterium]NJM89498.1 VOC family protein [Hydrococcus sp. RU_2_2]NJP19058.1 VOC family protein [Hydrococcus sp. CRU_1_1]NJQ97946.1 VOC family protein [Hydrococcus sp. CSU_1_8]